jgi:uncharacterized membrane protein
MKKKNVELDRMLLMSISFTLLLLTARIIFSGQMVYLFYPWNLFLALVPLLLSRKLKKYKKMSVKSFFIIAGWLLFFPNAPYLITDIFHFNQRLPVPYWYDLLLVMSGAWNGLILGIISLIEVEKFLMKIIKPFWVNCFCLLSFFLCAYGVYIGRFLRFNSWWVITNPETVLRQSAHHVLLPENYPQLWTFTFSFAVLLALIYFTLKKLSFYFRESITKNYWEDKMAGEI